MAGARQQEHVVRLGLGDAILRLVRVETRRALGLAVRQEAESEVAMLVATLAQYELEVGFDCDEDGQPDTVAIYEAAARDSCCRLVRIPQRGEAPAPAPAPTPRRKRGETRG